MVVQRAQRTSGAEGGICDAPLPVCPVYAPWHKDMGLAVCDSLQSQQYRYGGDEWSGALFLCQGIETPDLPMNCDRWG